MLELAIYIGIFELIDGWFARRLRNKLIHEPSSEMRLKIRRKMYFIRRLLLIGFLLFLMFIVVGATVSAVMMDSYRRLILSLSVLFVYFVVLKKWKRIKGHISTIDMASFNLNSHYSLFLRGFSTDDYDKVDELELNLDKSFERLSEYWFFKTISYADRRPVVSVGMTRELNAPFGTERIYLDDNTWNNDVKKLMHHAEVIYVLVNDSDSCVWEIMQTKDMTEKTVFLVDNQEKYDVVCRRIGSHINLPPVVLPEGRCAAISFEPEPDVVYFDNTPQGYATLVNIEYTELDKVETRAILVYFIIIGVLGILWLVMKMLNLPDPLLSPDPQPFWPSLY